MKFLRASAPRLATETVVAFIHQHFALSGELVPLYSERDQNFRLREASGASWVVKIANAHDDPRFVDCQIAALEHIAATDPAIPVPRVRRTATDVGTARLVLPDGTAHIVHVLSFLDGKLGHEAALSAAHYRDIGAMQARLGKALRGFFHPSAGRTLLWDVRAAPDYLPYTRFLPEAQARVIEPLVRDFTRRVLPELRTLRAQVLHADVHGHNLIVSPQGGVAGIIDFGDMIHGPLVLDLSNAIGDFLTAPGRIGDIARPLFEGFTCVTPLDERERALLYDLVVMRQAISLVVNAYRAAETPEEPNYLADGGFGTFDVLDDLLATGRARFDELLSASCARNHPEVPTPLDAILQRRRRLLGEHLYLFYNPPLHIVRGDGVWLFDAQGRRYMDCYNNVPIVGHCHPHVTAAIARQINLLNTNTRYLSEQVLDYAERLTAKTDGALTVAAFVNSGSEANDLAWRMAKAWTGARGALTQEFAYHGITDAIDAISPSASKTGARAPHVRTLIAPDGYRGAFKAGTPDLGRRYAEDADRAIASLGAAGLKPAAYFVDSAFMTNGILEPQEGYVAGVFERVRSAGGLCVADEVQSGFGRMGDHFWGYQHHGVTPDILTIGKPAGNGHPLGVVLTRPDIYDRFVRETAFFSTFGGNNVSCAAGLAVLDVIEGEVLIANAREVGAYLKAGLASLKSRHPIIGDVRGTGLAFGIELVSDRNTLLPARAATDRLTNLLRDEGLLVGSEGIHGNIIKMRPPMVFQRAHADIALDAFDRALARLDV